MNWKYFRLKNEMLLANFVANFFGVCAAVFLSYRFAYRELQEALRLMLRMASIAEPIALVFTFALTLIYERPIRRYLNLEMEKDPAAIAIQPEARRRLLNEPFFLVILNLSMWLAAAGLYSVPLWLSETEKQQFYHMFFQSLQTGLITSVVAFFLLRHVLQRRLAPHFFPRGGLYAVTKTLRIRISTRLIALLFASNLVPLFAIIAILAGTSFVSIDSFEKFHRFRLDIFVNCFIFMVAGLGITILMSLNLKQPFQDIIRVLRAVRNGDFNQKVKVTSNDEIGYTGDVINEMTAGLKEHDRMRRSLELAKEVQQHLIPKSDPHIPWLDIAGRSVYCERTGGDYFDYIIEDDSPDGKVQIVVGDVSGHGLPSAMLMASVRASLRQRALLGGSPAHIIADVNRQLVKDVVDSGRFMTLFFSEIDAVQRRLRWIRAGHDPAIFYDPTLDEIETLKGNGLALGIEANWCFEEQEKCGLKPGQVIVISTDGVWEAHNTAGDMFGKHAFYDVIRKNAGGGAKDILEAVLTAVDNFRHGLEPEDDITLIVVKIK